MGPAAPEKFSGDLEPRPGKPTQTDPIRPHLGAKVPLSRLVGKFRKET